MLERVIENSSSGGHALIYRAYHLKRGPTKSCRIMKCRITWTVSVSGSGNGRSVHVTRMSEHLTPEGRTRIQNLDRRSGMSLYEGYRETCRRMALDRKNPQAHCLLQQVYRERATARETTRTTVDKPARAGSSTLVWTSHARTVF